MTPEPSPSIAPEAAAEELMSAAAAGSTAPVVAPVATPGAAALEPSCVAMSMVAEKAVATTPKNAITDAAFIFSYNVLCEVCNDRADE